MADNKREASERTVQASITLAEGRAGGISPICDKHKAPHGPAVTAPFAAPTYQAGTLQSATGGD